MDVVHFTTTHWGDARNLVSFGRATKYEAVCHGHPLYPRGHMNVGAARLTLSFCRPLLSISRGEADKFLIQNIKIYCTIKLTIPDKSA